MLVSKWRATTLMLLVGVSMALLWGLLASSACAEGFKLKKTFGPDGTSLSEFSAAGSVAVDEVGGAVYVLDRGANVLYKFDVEGNPVNFSGSSPDLSGNELSGLAIGGGPGERQVAVDPTTHTIYLTGAEEFGSATAIQAFKASGEPSIFPATGTNEISGLPGIRGVAVDSSGNIYASGVEPGNPPTANNVNIYSRSGELLVPFAIEALAVGNIAVDADGVVYLIKNLQTLIRLVPSSFPVTPATTYTEQKVDAQVPVSVAVDPLTNQVYVSENAERAGSGVSQVKVFSNEGKFLRLFAGPGEEGELENPDGIAVFNGQVPDIVEKVAEPFVANNPSGGPRQVEIFEEKLCICEPAVEATFASAVTGDSATLRARINPNNLETTYWFEYGPEDCEFDVSCLKVPLVPVSIGHGRKGVLVTQPVSGLVSNTTYHFRVVAENEEGKTEGSERTFTTQGTGLGFALSDSRVWEMVSPSNKFNGQVVPNPTAIIQAKANGNGIVYASLGSIVAEPESNHPPQIASNLADRGEDGKWLSRDLSAPHTEAALISSEFKIFTPDLRRAAMEPSDSTPLSSEASEKTSYLWDDGNPPSFTPLVNPTNVFPPGTKFGPVPGAPDPVRIEGVSPNLDHVVIKSNSPLVEDAKKNSLYLWSSGDLEIVSELPESEGGEIVGESMLGSGRGSVRHAVSEDGTRVFWTPSIEYGETGIGLPSLYLRDITGEESVRLDVPQGGSGEGTARPAFSAASSDGSVVFFTDSQHLTADASPVGRDLYRCEIGQVEGGGLGCAELTDVSSPLATPGESAEALDQVSAVTDDGARLYFVARGVLDEAPNEEGEVATAGDPNLYYWQEEEGNRFVATLSERDSPVWGQGPNNAQGFSVSISAAASPSGRFFAFTSERSLTGLESHNESDEPTSEAYLYDAETGKLACVSCNPTGAAPIGERLSGKVYFPPDPLGVWSGRWVAATLPEASQNESSGRSFYHPRTALDNGRVFFNSVDPLVPADSNGNWDVYQFQSVGVGSCAASTSATAVVRSGDGCVSLVSSGTSEGDAGFLDTTSSGNDIFFLTKGRLSVLDRDDETDVYDARVNGIKAVLSPVQECAGESCQAATGPPNDPTPASESFHGPEPPLHCRKGQRKVQRKGRTACVRKHKKHGKHHKKRAGKNGRAGR